MKTPIVSVIIPTYRPGEYIVKCLDSFCAQSIHSEHVEIIVILNGEKNPYFEELTQYCNMHNEHNIVILYSETKGVSNARNMGINHSKGQYVVFADDDDWVSSNYLEELIRRADDKGIVLSNVVAFNNDGHLAEDYFISKAYKGLSGKSDISLFAARSYFSVPVGKIIPREIIADDRFFSDFSLGEDALFMFSISRRIRHITFTTPDVMYFVWLRSLSASRSNYTYLFRVRLVLRTVFRYTILLLRHPLGYSPMFFLSRIAATLRKLFQKEYR